MSMLVNDKAHVNPNNILLASLVSQEGHVDVNFIKRNNFNNNAYSNNFGSNNYRSYSSNNGNAYGNSYGNLLYTKSKIKMLNGATMLSHIV
jgi:hypothetical protein